MLLAASLLLAFPALAAMPCNGPFKGEKLNAQTLASVLAGHQAWAFSHFEKLMGRKQPPALARADLCLTDLSGADLTKANLSEAILQGAKMGGASLNGAFLAGADLSGANLALASLEGAVLRMADLRFAILSNANLRRADLGGANLEGARMNGANLSGAAFFDGHSRRKTDLSAVLLLGGEIESAVMAIPNLKAADLDGVIFEPKTGRPFG